LVLGLACAGLIFAIDPSVDRPVTFLVLALVAAVAEIVPVRFVHAGQTQGFTLHSSAVVALLLSGYAHLTPLLVVVSFLLVHGLRSRSLIKTLFNSARGGVESSLAAVAFLSLAPAQPAATDPRSLVAVVVALAVFELSSMIMTTELMSRLGRRTRRE